MKVSLIIPMYNESKIIADTARRLADFMSNNFDEYEIIFSDDGSTDTCREIIENIALPNVRVTGYEQNRGKGAAVRHGMLSADGDICIFTDADIAYGTEVIKKAVEDLSENSDADLLIGSRNMDSDGYEGYTFGRKLMSKAYIKVLCWAGGFKLTDSQCGFKAFRGNVAKDIFEECTTDGFAFDFEIILRANKKNNKIIEMPVKIVNHRESSVRPVRDAIRMLKDLKRIKKSVNE